MHSAKKKREENLEDFSCTPQFFLSRGGLFVFRNQ